MIPYMPITLIGNTLGERHRYLNSLVNDAYQTKIPLQDLLNLPEESAIDRLFKIDLASKHRNVDYILNNLKDDDMLYVSRALKCTWLLDSQYGDVINPTHLETVLYPEMLTTAVNKMKQWIYLNFKDTARCEEFYQYYSQKNLDLAIKFLWHCSDEFIKVEIVKILEKITPQRLKLLSETCPQAVCIYFDNLKENQSLIAKYIGESKKYFNSIKGLLKVKPELFLDITEKFYENYCFDTLSPAATSYIMKNHKDRFFKKPELYTAWLLNVKTLAKCLNNEEIKDLVIKLARAEYVSSWFSFKTVEPLIKSINVDERSAFKKKIFVEKSFGDKVKEWPYPIPSAPNYLGIAGEKHVFTDTDNVHMPFPSYGATGRRRVIKRKKCSAYQSAFCDVISFDAPIMVGMSARNLKCIIKPKTFLDQLHDRFRFDNFEKTLFELRKQLTAESSSQNREFMLLVLVSKSGGRTEWVEELLNLLITQHKNEPVHVRAAVVRSLAKRAAVWRLPEQSWQILLQFARGLGLDGSEPEAACNEGLHAVVLHDILLTGTCQPAVLKAFLKDFSTLTEYKLDATEKKQIIDKLPSLILAAVDAEPSSSRFNFSADYLTNLLNFFEAYKVRADTYPGTMSAIIKLYNQDPTSSVDILTKLFDARIARKQLFRENFAINQTNASYLNALRHDAKILEKGDKFQEKVQKCNVDPLCLNGFLQKLAIYFSEEKGLREHYRSILENEINLNRNTKLARSLAQLAGKEMSDIVKRFDGHKESEHKRLAAILRANIHLSRPKVHLDTFGWRSVGAKAVANEVTVCRHITIEEYVRQLLLWPRTFKLALILSERNGKEVEAFSTVGSQKPTVAIKLAIRYLKRRSKDYDARVWNIIKPLIAQADLSKPRFENLRTSLIDVDSFPKEIKGDYCMVLYNALQKGSRENAVAILSCINRELTTIDDTFILENIILPFMEKELTLENISIDETTNTASLGITIQIIAKYLLLSRTEKSQNNKLETVAEPFLNRLKTILEVPDKKVTVIKHLTNFITSLKYSPVYFDTSYVSSLPVFEKIQAWMREVIPITRHLELYCTMHLTMLYFKSIRQGIKHNPEIFSNKKTKEVEGVEIVGTVFGKYLAHEIKDLITKYFDSIVLLYGKCMWEYISNNLNFGKSRDELVCVLVKGFLEASEDSKSRLLLVKTFLDCGRHLYNDYSKTIKDIIELLKKVEDKEMKFYLHALTTKNYIPL